MSIAIQVENLHKSYLRMAPGFRLRTLKSALLQRSLVGGHREEDTILALEDVSFTVKKGTAFGVIGSNGSGKSTLLNILGGLDTPTAGQVFYRDQELTCATARGFCERALIRK